MKDKSISVLSLFTSTSTLVCCAIPAFLVAVGAGASLAGAISSFPQLIWFSDYKIAIFIAATLMLAINGILLWKRRNEACPLGLSPQEVAKCGQARKLSQRLFLVSAVLCVMGAMFAFVIPYLLE